MNQQIKDALSWRYATKKFDATKKLSQQDVDTIIETARLAPTSFGLQPLRLINVSDPALRTKIRTASWDQSQVTDASHLFIIAYLTSMDEKYIEDYIKRIADTRGVDTEGLEQYKQMMTGTVKSRPSEQVAVWNSRQAYIVLGMMLETAALLKVDSCPMEGFDTAKVDEILGLKEKGLSSVVMVTMGYRSPEDAHAKDAKVRLSKDQILIGM